VLQKIKAPKKNTSETGEDEFLPQDPWGPEQEQDRSFLENSFPQEKNETGQ
jgi:hypothetical protein